MWNASDLRRTKRNHLDGKTRIYTEVLNKCINKLYKASLKGKSDYYFKVPTFIVGLPLYNYDKCLVYLIKELREKDYYVRFHPPSHLFISWDENPEDDYSFILQDESNRTYNLFNKSSKDSFNKSTLKIEYKPTPQQITYYETPNLQSSSHPSNHLQSSIPSAIPMLQNPINFSNKPMQIEKRHNPIDNQLSCSINNKSNTNSSISFNSKNIDLLNRINKLR